MTQTKGAFQRYEDDNDDDDDFVVVVVVVFVVVVVVVVVQLSMRGEGPTKKRPSVKGEGLPHFLWCLLRRGRTAKKEESSV